VQPLPPPAPVVTGGAIVAGGAAFAGSASMAAQAGLAAAFYRAETFRAAAVTRDVLTLWQQLSLRDVRSSWPVLRTALTALIRDRFAQSAVQGAEYYRQARQAAGITSRLPLSVTQPPAEPLIQATLDSTGPYSLLGRIKQGQPLPQASDNTGVQLAGAAQRLVSNGARLAVLQSVDADAKAVAWARVTSGNPCAFCAMLAGRGAVYRTEATASFEAHNHCSCVAMPVFSHDDVHALRDNPLAQQWKQATKGYSGREARNAWRRHWDAQQNRDGVRVLPSAAA
jgi:hypothetical protein